jgi:PHD/YefM family antitoxin component YafN of YafNO toxin-antitoxin module
MPTVDATTFRRDFGRYQDEAQREPVKVTSHGRLVGVFLSSHDLEHYENLKRREAKDRRTGKIQECVKENQNADDLKSGS